MQYQNETFLLYEKERKKEEAKKLKEREDKLVEQYEEYKDMEISRIRTTIRIDELAEFENITRAKLQSEGSTPYFMMDGYPLKAGHSVT